MRFACNLAFCLLSLLPCVRAQQMEALPRIPAETAKRHLISKIEPQYPPMAKIAHVEGEVVLKIIISPSGTVENMHALAGHPILLKPLSMPFISGDISRFC